MHHHAITQRRSRIQHRPWINPAILANHHALADHRARFNPRPIADHGVVSYHRTRLDRNGLPDLHVAAEVMWSVNPGRRQRRLQQLRRPRKPQTRLIGLNHAHRGPFDEA